MNMQTNNKETKTRTELTYKRGLNGEQVKGIREVLNALSEARGTQSCAFSKFTVDGNRLDSFMTCKDPLGGEGNIAFTGTVHETGFDIVMDTKLSASDVGEFGVKVTILSERIGECP